MSAESINTSCFGLNALFNLHSEEFTTHVADWNFPAGSRPRCNQSATAIYALLVERTMTAL